MKKNESETFEQRFKFLEELSKELNDGLVSVDQLVPKMKQASDAIRVCKEVLKNTKLELVEVEREFEELMTDEEGK